jgi:uncharacterized protein YodC (DUF2158 family)
MRDRHTTPAFNAVREWGSHVQVKAGGPRSIYEEESS